MTTFRIPVETGPDPDARLFAMLSAAMACQVQQMATAGNRGMWTIHFLTMKHLRENARRSSAATFSREVPADLRQTDFNTHAVMRLQCPRWTKTFAVPLKATVIFGNSRVSTTPPIACNDDEEVDSVLYRRCAVCRKRDGSLQRCGKCHSIYYCSATCQKAHWPEHKAICRQHVMPEKK